MPFSIFNRTQYTLWAAGFMMIKLNISLFIILTLSMLCCQKAKKDIETEREIFASLLPKMVEAIYKYPDIYLNFRGTFKNLKGDSLHLVEPAKQANDHKKIIVAISEILNPPDDIDSASLQHFIKTLKLKIQVSSGKYSHKLLFLPFKNVRYVFKYIPKNSEKESVIYTDGVKVSHISVSFSRIQFDEMKEYGILTGTYDCQPSCGVGYVIVVRKASVGWEIYKVFDTWVS